MGWKGSSAHVVFVEQGGVVEVEVAVYESQQCLADPTALVLNTVLVQVTVNDAHFLIAH